ncbi:MAG: hypothetical protein JRH11_27055 [Deltaproteobacteria bacterium]|nr:hypothetical protein [Deltaproteobacteria bacterium]
MTGEHKHRIVVSMQDVMTSSLAALLLIAGAACSDDTSMAGDSGADSGGPDAGSDAAADGGRDAAAGDASVDAAIDTAVPPGPDAGGGDFTPYVHDDFEEYGEGGRPTGGFSRTTATSEQAYRGTQSARMAIEPGDNGGFGDWGAEYSIDPAVPKGGEVWVRVYAYWPSSFAFSASPYMKFLRLHNRDGAGENDGYNDLYIDDADGPSTVLRCIKEVHDVWQTDEGPALPRDAWEHYEMYLYVDDVPVDSGGQGRFRIWRDGALVFDRTDVPTINTADGTVDLFLLFTYWNNEMPPSNHVFIDDVTIATSASPPPNRDAAGNAFIGDWAP